MICHRTGVHHEPRNLRNGILSLAECDHVIRKVLGLDAPRPVINRAFHGARDIVEVFKRRLPSFSLGVSEIYFLNRFY